MEILLTHEVGKWLAHGCGSPGTISLPNLQVCHYSANTRQLVPEPQQPRDRPLPAVSFRMCVVERGCARKTFSKQWYIHFPKRVISWEISQKITISEVILYVIKLAISQNCVLRKNGRQAHVSTKAETSFTPLSSSLTWLVMSFCKNFR